MDKSGKPVAVELFCGCGGLTFGMRKAGIKVLAGIDNDPKFKETYEINNSGVVYINRDVKSLTGKEVKQIFSGHRGPRILAGCAPCRPFSNMNREKSELHKDYSLLLEFGQIIREVKPDGIIMENVPQLANRGKEIFEKFLDAVHDVGLVENYESSVDFAAYGIPQHRKRMVLVASRKQPVLPRQLYGPGRKYPFRTVEETIGRYPAIASGHLDRTSLNHSTKSLSAINLERLKAIPHDGGSRKDIPVSLWIETHKTHSGHGDTYGRMKWKEPAPTLTSKCTSITNGRFAHPDQDRGISIREAAALQTFPDKYFFPLGLLDAQRCIGNAVPPLVAEKLTRSLLASIKV